MKHNKKNKKTVFVGMSGGVDSSVSAAILKNQGFDVVGVFIKTWHPDFLACTEEEERLDAMRVCAHLNIPFLTFDFEDVYKKEVADYMIAEYKAGRTPNPDVMCNKHVKFGAFFNKAIEMGADYVATGHYARTEEIKNLTRRGFLFAQESEGAKRRRRQNSLIPQFLFKKGLDETKDQSYFLWTLRTEQLSKIIFPIGHLEKTEVRKLAIKFKLPVAEKKDSQGICFLGAVDLKDFLKHYIKSKNGKVLSENGEEIGHHDGALFYTLGERHGFVITKKGPNDGAYYVVAKDIKKNILYVSQSKNNFLENTKQVLFRSSYSSSDAVNERNRAYVAESTALCVLKLKEINWISGIPKEDKNYQAQIRYHGEFLLCKIKIINKNEVEVIFNKPILVDKGQSCVLYDKNIVLGGGIIK